VNIGTHLTSGVTRGQGGGRPRAQDRGAQNEGF